MKARNNLISFAMAFASYLLQNLKQESAVRNIVLFGSVARNDFDKESDIDIFIDTKEEIEKEANDILDSFYSSIIYKKYWKLLGIENEISLKVGDLDKWELKRSIISHGIQLYGKYYSEIEARLYSLFVIEFKGKRSEKLKLWRQLYGYSQKIKNKQYIQQGLIKEYSIRRIGPAVLLVPIENENKLRQFLTENKISHKVIEIQTDNLGEFSY